MTTVLFIIGYLVVGMLVFKIEKIQDNRYYEKMMETFNGEEYEVVTDYGILVTANKMMDEYHRRTNWIPKEITKNKLIIGCILALVIWVLWPVAAIVFPIWNCIVFKQIMKKAETPV